MNHSTATRDLLARTVDLDGRCPDPAQLLSLQDKIEGLVALESLCEDPVYGRYSVVSSDPAVVLRCSGPEHNPFDQLQAVLDACRIPVSPLPFAGGLLGYLSYEAGRCLERLPGRAVRDLELPDAWFALYDTVAVLDHQTRTWKVAGVTLPGTLATGRPPLEHRLDRLEALIRAADGVELAAARPAAPPAAPPVFDFDLYAAQVRRILKHIRDGDIYQANLSQRFAVKDVQDGFAAYLALRRHNPADYMAYLHCGDHQVLCSSPELFLQVRDGNVVTRPIKGTRPRSPDRATDQALRTALCRSEKDLAELAMIVDLERNDLARVCDDVMVAWPPVVESYRSVHHLVAEVRGRLGGEAPPVVGWSPRVDSPIDVLRAAFPGGSITGAPKIRAMEVIDELEPVARGPYCGSIGFLGLDRRMTLNIAIRTMVHQGGTMYLHAGSGIVADSDPRAEYEEVLAKAERLFAALGVSPPHAALQPTGDAT